MRFKIYWSWSGIYCMAWAQGQKIVYHVFFHSKGALVTRVGGWKFPPCSLAIFQKKTTKPCLLNSAWSHNRDLGVKPLRYLIYRVKINWYAFKVDCLHSRTKNCIFMCFFYKGALVVWVGGWKFHMHCAILRLFEEITNFSRGSMQSAWCWVHQ